MYNLDNYIYMDNAAATKTEKEVIEAMLPYFDKYYAVASSQFSHQPGIKSNEALEKSRETIAKKFNVSLEEVIFTSGATESNNLAIKGYVRKNRNKGNHIITSKIEHYSVLNSFKALEREGFEVTYLDVNKNGLVNIDQLEKELKDNTIFVSIQYVNQETGTIQDIQTISNICKKKGVVFHTDASLAAGKIDIDFQKTHIDLLSLSSNKIFGPKGVGALIIRKNLKLSKIMDGGFNEFNIRAGTENIPGIVGFAKAIEIYNKKKLEKLKLLDKKLMDGLLKIEESDLNGSFDKKIPGIINISFYKAEGEAIILHLDMKGIGVITGSACFSRTLEPSYVLIAMGHTYERAHGSIRYSLSHHNTEKEIDYVISSTKEVVEKLRSFSAVK